jgi:hypothetical protein
MFPWGHKIAQLFHAREWEKLVLRYEPSCPADTGGQVAAVNNPNPDEPPFNSMDELLRSERSVQSAPWKGWTVNLLSSTTQAIPRKFNETLTGVVGLGVRSVLDDSLKLLADGVVNIAVKGLQSLIGEEKKMNAALIENLKALAERKGTDAKEIAGVIKATTDPTEMVVGRLYVDYRVRLINPVNDNVDVGMFYSTGAVFTPINSGDTPLAFQQEWNVFAEGGETINELGAEMTWTVNESNPANASLGVDVFEDGYYLITLDVESAVYITMNSWTVHTIAFPEGDGVHTPLVSPVLGLCGYRDLTDNGAIDNLFEISGTPPMRGREQKEGKLPGDWSFQEQRNTWAGVVYFSALDVPAGEGIYPNRLATFNLALEINNAYTPPNANLTAKFSVTFIGEDLEMSALASSLAGKKAPLDLPRNRAFFHHLHEKRARRAAETRKDAQEIVKSLRGLDVEKPRAAAPDVKPNVSWGLTAGAAAAAAPALQATEPATPPGWSKVAAAKTAKK